jgi:hypothetical protein
MWYCSGPFLGREAAKEMLTVDAGVRSVARICIEACVRVCLVLYCVILYYEVKRKYCVKILSLRQEL